MRWEQSDILRPPPPREFSMWRHRSLGRHRWFAVFYLFSTLLRYNAFPLCLSCFKLLWSCCGPVIGWTDYFSPINIYGTGFKLTVSLPEILEYSKSR